MTKTLMTHMVNYRLQELESQVLQAHRLLHKLAGRIERLEGKQLELEFLKPAMEQNSDPSV